MDESPVRLRKLIESMRSVRSITVTSPLMGFSPPAYDSMLNFEYDIERLNALLPQAGGGDVA